MDLKDAGWTIILLSREPGTQRNVTTYHLLSVGFRGWSSLMMRYEVHISFIYSGGFELLSICPKTLKGKRYLQLNLAKDIEVFWMSN